ncbi:MAG: 1-(5-phosphoribosyl)-5-[(5-phosphoribosylamino)methylideneamino]imidazole-4-carboxamide isomerase [Rubinisphaera brasiliensis]|uniref:1-(5-phosphoribosyl)-5-[(5-phosphoribosylamino)methylideneamino] imidazole-4-carboxamide isomerase n=1 Tax=Rubinisphaera brasiliensis (strain ATCC 49424 / DSM 5305 / JCM 21570 / IAM 15109 / NBRC 103401 / IFAM 1448) TaxID=756272 RepID=F0SN77_RUBBR|nr:1-(5-phosphoribosyl)-5-[(5-phosphoribosylamino)methylideneamino]imidazole-4-carboxamide isomerase [Rubinisphaera brasiliensis]ADY61106.1 1-(5-phosphoribosyl)-5-((5-phosphoribosylamino)methylideneamino) imidazole-4-carboxamide isomerase [Rubinisphaera brasiliensis DSM 5305]
MIELIPAIDLRDGRCVRLRQGDYNQETVFNDDPVEVARQWQDQGASRIHLVDLDGAKAGSVQNGEVIRAIVKAVDVPCQLGGGLRNSETVKQVLEDIGIDRAIVGTQALKQPHWFREMVETYPNRVALGLDARDSMVATAGWLEVSQTSALELARQFTGLPVAAVIYTNIANDGMMQGVDEGTLKDLAELAGLKLPVIASGGVTTIDDVKRLLEIQQQAPDLNGAIIGRALYEGTINLPEAIAISQK